MYDPTRPPPAPGQMGITSMPQGQRVAPVGAVPGQLPAGFQMPQMGQRSFPQAGGFQMPDLSGLPGGGVQNMPNIGPRPMHGNRGGMGGANVQAFVDALRGWIGQRPEDMTGDARQTWMSQRPTWQGFNTSPDVI